ncbi:MAG: hypothetical protein JSS78_01920, partial [Bacteroidetes bacterium]|nr:hypothetical protein [Bacteroidota bacterium]
MKHFIYFLLTVCFAGFSARGATETEPNNTFAQANSIAYNTAMIGTINCSGDQADFFYGPKSFRGTMQVYLEVTNTGVSNGSVNFYMYDKAQNLIVNNYLVLNNSNLSPNVTYYDTLTINCRDDDSLYFLMYGGNQCFNYKITYKVPSPITVINDIGTHNALTNAAYFNATDSVVGLIQYTNASGTNSTDIYKTKLPQDGTARVYIQRTNTGGSGNQYVYFQVYDKAQNQIYNDINGYVSPGQTRYDTLNFYCRASDSMYFALTSPSSCFSYKLSYQMLNSNGALHVDTTNNNSFATAAYLKPTDSVNGSIGYVNGSNTYNTDDFFKTKLPQDGTLRVYIQRTNTGGSGNQYVYFQVYDKALNQIYNDINGYVSPGQTRYDTLNFYCRASDSMYFRMTSPSSCFSYKLSYQMLNNNGVLHVDTTNNNSFATAAYLKPTDSVNGSIGYVNGSNASNSDDFFKTKLPQDGTLRVYIQRTTTGGAGNQYVYFQLYDKVQNQIYSAINGYVNPGQTRYDTLDFYCRASDSMYFRMTSPSSCFSYKLSYQMLNSNSNGVLHVDTTNNNSFATAAYLKPTDSVNGSIGYVNGSNASNSDDFFKTKLPQNGTLRVYIQRTNTGGAGNQYVYFQLYDNTQNQFYSDINGYVNPGQTRYDTLNFYCRTSDSIYFRMTSPSSCFSYKFHYEVTLGADTTVYVCPGFTTDISNLYNLKPFDIITYTNMSGGAMPPLTLAPNGLYRLAVQNSNYACSKDTAFITVGLYPKPNLGNDTTANVCPFFTANLTTFKNTTGLITQWIGTATPAAVGPGVYTLIVTNAQGCMDTAVITIGLNPKPNIGNDTTANICPGFPTDLTTFKNTTGLTTQWIGTATPTNANAGIYSLIVTNLQ